MLAQIRCSGFVAVFLMLGGGVFPRLAAEDTSSAQLAHTFDQTVRPFLANYCVGCHSGAAPAAQLDLKGYATIGSVTEDFGRWNQVLGKLSARQMPPKGAKQPPDEARQQVIDWVVAMRANEARKNAGDPGVVMARRLSNAEYNYTIRDLTGVDIRPAREFPVDPANTAGFDNSGESLTMSPALLNKYLQAAREVGDHMVLTPGGFDFAPHPMLVETDRDRYAIKRIVDFYHRQPTDYADYFQAAWRYKHRVALGEKKATLASVAAESKVSAKYLPMVWGILEEKAGLEKQEVGPIAKLQAMWHALPEPSGDPDALRAQCVAMRDFVVRIRQHTAMQFSAPVVKGLPDTSQPLLNWKYIQFNTHRRNFDPSAVLNDTDPPPVIPEILPYPGLHHEAAPRWATLSARARAGDQDLVVPAAERQHYEASFARLASVFPDVFYVSERGRYFPDDSEDKGRLLSAGYHNVMGYWRDDQPLMELILDEKGQKELNLLWDEFDVIADHTARTYTQFYFNESGEVNDKGAESGHARPEDRAITDPSIIFGLRNEYVAKAEASDNPIAVGAIKYHFQWENDTLRRIEKMRADAEPKQLDALIDFAMRAYRRPLTSEERASVLGFYSSLREKGGLTHEEAIRDSIVSVLMSPKFCYRLDLNDEDEPSAGKAKPVRHRTVAVSSGAPRQPLSPYALASRLSYFLWSSMPDEELLARAKSGDLAKTEVIAAEARRMLNDDRAIALATEFAGNWLDFRQFEDFNSVDRDRFPSFTNELREAMFEEPVRFVTDMFRNDRSVLDLLYGNYTFVNPVLARHYGMPEVSGGADHWVRVDDAERYGRGGLLPMAVFLTENSPGLRTSPVKRGYWVVHRVLGEVIPPPPPNVPELPSDEAKLDLPLRDVLANHRANPACGGCHARFDTFGLALEGYGPVGESRTKDLAGHPVDTKADFPGGAQGSGFQGIQAFIREHRERDFIDSVCRKLLAYSLSRSLMMSDEITIEQMKNEMAANGNRFLPLVEAIVTSPQFLSRRSSNSQDQKGEFSAKASAPVH